jgi:hypothetical protein
MESQMEELILNHNMAILRIEDCEDDMNVCKGDIDPLKINLASLERDSVCWRAPWG